MSSTIRRLWLLFASFVVGMGVGFVAPKLIGAAVHRMILPISRKEVARAVSPDGTVDAVMMVTDCGAPCSFAYAVYVVPKGQEAPASNTLGQDVFSAENVVDGKLVWRQSHLLEISYSKALIDGFRNLVYPFGKIGDEASWRYAVEVRLSPASTGFSYLPDDTSR
ncbi:MAG: hypothetical protein AUG83_00480 [Acidobacteria bacterium 13_1_20CM_4_57_11]|nr:MAG: hypothetical protein AUI02_01140 [Acidobacteria bacterium 13_2_20CM_2_57_12]OLE17093.1 MAG: hypothetical protein AUG83_00480 [Acidobacteria bacterium 13_1_20CM_4_57_11]